MFETKDSAARSVVQLWLSKLIGRGLSRNGWFTRLPPAMITRGVACVQRMGHPKSVFWVFHQHSFNEDKNQRQKIIICVTARLQKGDASEQKRAQSSQRKQSLSSAQYHPLSHLDLSKCLILTEMPIWPLEKILWMPQGASGKMFSSPRSNLEKSTTRERGLGWTVKTNLLIVRRWREHIFTAAHPS